MPEIKSTRGITDYLRGLGIIAVLVTHYVGVYDHDFYAQYVSNYANMFLAIFFILAGYGAFHSFERRFSAGGSKTRIILAYYLDRALRIFPLYWLALMATALISPAELPVNELGIVHLLGIFTAWPLFISPLWFVPAIIQCYIFAPFLYLLYRKVESRKFIFFNMLMISLLLMFSHVYAGIIYRLQNVLHVQIPGLEALFNRGIFMGNVFLFSLGLVTPYLIATYGHRLQSRIILFASGFFMVALGVILRYDIVVRGEDLILMEALYYASVFFFCWSMLVQQAPTPFKKPISLAGRYSFSIYLFHDALLFQALFDVNLLQLRLPLSLAIVMVLLPVLAWFCIVSEKAAGYLRQWFWKVGRKVLFSAGNRELTR